jgi:hypothetical protein
MNPVHKHFQKEKEMKKLIWITVAALCVASITCCFAPDPQPPGTIKEKALSTPKKVVPGSTDGGLNTQQTVPVTSDWIDPDVAKIAYAMVPQVEYPTMPTIWAMTAKNFQSPSASIPIWTKTPSLPAAP